MSSSRVSVVLAAAVIASILAVGCGRARVLPSSARAAPRDPRSDFRPTAWQPFSPEIDVPPRKLAFDALCGDTPDRCDEACPGDGGLFGFAECAIGVRYGDDAEGLALARELLEKTGTIPGLETKPAIDGGYLGDVPVVPALPTKEYRRHLEWVVGSVMTYESLFAKLAPMATREVMFRTRPHAFRFYKTERPSYPSAYAIEGVVGYNVEGVLHTTAEQVTATLFHELFHLNDEGHGRWSEHALAELFTAIRQTCRGDHECLTPYAPDDTVVPDGTYYAFDERTGEVREYAAEVALRWFREQRAILESQPIEQPPFKCRTPENALAWQLVVREFFGEADLVPACPGEATASSGEGTALDSR